MAGPDLLDELGEVLTGAELVEAAGAVRMVEETMPAPVATPDPVWVVSHDREPARYVEEDTADFLGLVACSATSQAGAVVCVLPDGHGPVTAPTGVVADHRDAGGVYWNADVYSMSAPSGLDEFLPAGPACPECGPPAYAMGEVVRHRAGCSRASASASDIPENPKSVDVTPPAADLLGPLLESVRAVRAAALSERRRADAEMAARGETEATVRRTFDIPGDVPLTDATAVRTAQQLADAETAVRRVAEAAEAVGRAAARPRRGGKSAAVAEAEAAARAAGHRVKVVGRAAEALPFISPAGEVLTITGPDATPERQQGLCRDGAWRRDPDDGTWSCGICGKPAAAPVLAEIEALDDDEPGRLVEVDLPPLQPRSRWVIAGASPDPAKPEDAQVGDPLAGQSYWCADCNSKVPGQHIEGCAFGPTSVELLGPDTRDDPKIRGVWLGPVRDSFTHDLGDGPVHHGYDTGAQYGPQAFGPPWATSAGPLGPIRITLPGVYHLTDLEYHNPRVTGAWVSNSDLKAMSLPGCPAKWKFKRDNGIKDERDVFQFGKAAHRRVLGVGAEVVARPLVNPADSEQAWDSWRTNAAKEWRAEQQAAGRVVVTPEEAEVIEEMAAAILANEHAAALLARPGRGEVALFWRELLPSGRWVQRRAMLDFLPDSGPIADYKTCDVAAPDDQMARAISRFRYHRQAATYTAAVVALDLPAEADIVFLFQEKTAPYLVTPVNLDDPTMMAAEIQTRQALEVYADCLESGVWPGYTDGTVTMSIPEYELREYEQEIK